MKNYKKNTLSLFIFTLLSVWANLANAALCTGSGAAASPITDTGEALATCTTEPDLYRVKLYEMGLCTTTPSLTNRATVCKSVVNNPDGSLITVQNGVDTVIPGTFTRPNNGVYTYGYIVIAPEFRITAVKNFGNSKKLKGKTGYGSVCWTLAGTYRDSGNTGSYDGSGALTAIAANTRSTYMAECASTAGTAAEAVIVQDAFGGADISGDGDATATATVDGQTVTAHLTDSDMLADATSSANVTRLVGFTLFPTAVNVTDDTRKFISSFKVSEGSMIGYDGVGAGKANDGDTDDANSLGSVKYIGSGPFAVKVTVQ
jgi:hypothetical protein